MAIWTNELIARRALSTLRQEPEILVDADLDVVADNGVLRRWLGIAEGSPGALLGDLAPDDRALLEGVLKVARDAPPGWRRGTPLRLHHAAGGLRTLALDTNNQLGDPVLGVLVVHGRDVAHELLTSALPDSETLLREVVDNSPVALVTLDPDGVVRFAAGAALAAPADQLVGRRLRDLSESPEQAAHLDRALTGVELTVVSPWEGRHWQARYRPLWRDGTLTGVACLFTDITEQKALEQRLEQAALTDPVTGVANRVTLADRLSHALARRTTGLVAVLFLDVDNLKQTNDTLGHAAGDAVLRHVASRTAATLRPEDTLARYGGDEFVVVCEELHAPQEAAALAERIRLAVTSPLTASGTELSATVSVGVAVSPPHAAAADELVAAADAAAYAAKRAGRNAVRLAE